MLQTVLLISQVLMAALLVGLILIQRGKGAEAGAAFGAGASGTVFGAAGSANFLSRTTAVLATLFIVNSLVLANLAARRTATQSVLEAMPAQATETVDLVPMPGEAADEELPVVLPPEGDGN